MRANRWLPATTLAATLLVAACGGGEDAETTGQNPAGPTTSTTTTSTSGEQASDVAPYEPALVARTTGEVAVHSEPGGEPSHTLSATTPFGTDRALRVLEDRGDWLEVQLPERPNETTGWVAAEQVDELREVPTAIEIDLDSRTLTFYEDGEEVLTTEVAIGTADNPTPTGEFHVTDKLLTDDPGGAYGPFAFGVSAWSDTLSEFGGGDGQIGIHGTNTPGTIGEPVSHGCVRVPNDVAELLNERLHLGSPVTIS